MRYDLTDLLILNGLSSNRRCQRTVPVRSELTTAGGIVALIAYQRCCGTFSLRRWNRSLIGATASRLKSSSTPFGSIAGSR